MTNWIKSAQSNKWYAKDTAFCVVSLECESTKYPTSYFLVHAIDSEGWIINTNAPVSRHRSANAAFRAIANIAA